MTGKQLYNNNLKHAILVTRKQKHTTKTKLLVDYIKKSLDCFNKIVKLTWNLR